MASSINSILGIGAGALFAHQNSIQTTGNNIANVDTPGYSRQKVRYETNPSLNASPGQIGQGVRATEVYRMFNKFVEKAYIDKASDSSRWAEQYALLYNVDSLVYESENIPGVAGTLGKFFDGWQVVSQNGTLLSSREALLSQAETLAGYVREMDGTLKYMQEQMDGLIQVDIDRANTLIQDIAQLNNQINQHSIPGQNNPNSLLDQRDLKVRELAEIIDIDIIDKGEGHYTVSTKSGVTLVEEGIGYSFEFHGAKATKYLTQGSNYAGMVNYTGTDEYEYTLEVVNGGAVDGGATFRVSLDGGRSWLKDENGNDLTFPANGAHTPVYVKDLEISFDAGNLRTGDRFEIVPKSAIYWNSPTTGLLNMTPQTFQDGTLNPRRLTGGTITAYFEFRDHLVGEYRERLDTFARSLAWEVNRIHSQGVGLEKLASVLGDYAVKNTTVPLGSNLSGLAWADKLQAGNFTLAIYDPATGEPVMAAPGMQAMLDVNFDPATDSLQDLMNNINGATSNVNPDAPPATFITASIVNGQLQLQTNSDAGPPEKTYRFGVCNDSSGVLAGLGINTFFKGEDAHNFSVRADIVANLNLINAGSINGGAEGNSGDTNIALEIAQLANKKVSITSPTGVKSEQTLLGYYSTFVTKVGADTQAAKYNTALYGSMAQDLRDQQDSIAGVNLDEEMTNLVRFQNSYKAAAKLITTADEMLQTIIGLKQ